MRSLNKGSLLLLLLPALVSFAWGYDLEYLLHIDRFHFYLSELAGHVKKVGREDVAKAILSFTPEDLAKAGFTEKQLSSAQNYDDLIIGLLRDKNSQLSFRDEEVRWNYNFFKNKLNESFRIENENGAPEPYNRRYGRQSPESPSNFTVPDVRREDMTMETDLYIADRTTRAAFWDVAVNKRPIEFHMGSQRDFLDRLLASKGKIVAEIRPRARNYNKIYLVQYPGQPQPVLAITQISGYDRLIHLVDQVSLITWNGKNGVPASKTVSVFGKPGLEIAEAETNLIRQLASMPKADHVIIGQKGAMEAAFRIASKAEAVTRLYAASSKEVEGALEPSQLKMVKKLAAVSKSAGFFPAFHDGSEWDKIYEKLLPAFTHTQTPLAAGFESFTIENDSHDITDVVLRNRSGHIVRWRLISNTWGDEIFPIARALRATGHGRITYAGTAGALPGSGLEVGDLMVPDAVFDSKGNKIPLSTQKILPAYAKKGGAVAPVDTPYEEERKKWLPGAQKVAKAVELETGHLGEAFAGDPNIELNIFLLISDVVGSESNLATAESNSRRKALDNFIQGLFDSDQAVAPASVNEAQSTRVMSPAALKAAKIEEILRNAFPTRDNLSLYQLRQVALRDRLEGKEQILAMAKNQKPFTTEALSKQLLAAGEVLSYIIREAEKHGIKPNIHAGLSLQDGTWNPKTDVVQVLLSAEKPEDKARLDQEINSAFKVDPKMRKVLEVSTTVGPPAEGAAWSSKLLDLGTSSRTILLDHYGYDGALKNAGLVPRESRTGSLKFVQIPFDEQVAEELLAISSAIERCVLQKLQLPQ